MEKNAKRTSRFLESDYGDVSVAASLTRGVCGGKSKLGGNKAQWKLKAQWKQSSVETKLSGNKAQWKQSSVETKLGGRRYRQKVRRVDNNAR
jgi:hypothetical protein